MSRERLKTLLLLTAAAMVPPGVFVAAGLLVFGSPRVLAAWVGGRPMWADVHRVSPSEYRVSITNLQSRDIAILGIRPDCMCTVVDSGSWRIPPSGRQTRLIKVEDSGLQTKRYVHVFCDVPGWSELEVTLVP